jgi:small-conductance mechanosensitive channel
MANDNITDIESELTDWTIASIDWGTILSILYTIVAAYLIVKILSYLFKKLSERAGQYRITIAMIIPLMKIIVYGSALYLIIGAIIEPSLSQLVAFSGLFGAALGFGLKDVFADIIGGIVITFERPYQIGDKVSMGDSYGEVVDIGIRSTRIVTPDDSLVSIPNFLIFSQASASGNAGKTEMMVVIDLFIDPESDAELAMNILKDAVVTSKYVYISSNRPYTILQDDFPYYRRIRAKSYVNDLRYEFEFKSEVTRRAWNEMKRQGIEHPVIPAPVEME